MAIFNALRDGSRSMPFVQALFNKDTLIVWVVIVLLLIAVPGAIYATNSGLLSGILPKRRTVKREESN